MEDVTSKAGGPEKKVHRQTNFDRNRRKYRKIGCLVRVYCVPFILFVFFIEIVEIVVPTNGLLNIYSPISFTRFRVQSRTTGYLGVQLLE